MKPHKYQVGEKVITETGAKVIITRHYGWGGDKHYNGTGTPQYKVRHIKENLRGEFSYTEDYLKPIKKSKLTIKLNLYENKRSTISN